MNIKDLPLMKIMAKANLERKLSSASISKAKSDFHAKRKPRPCGLTIHSAIGCPNSCLYCYIQDMGFDFAEAKPYGLTGDELLYALLTNPYFIPSRWGTFLAFGSIADPFNVAATNKTIEYLNTISILGNPCQFSTKAHIDEDLALKLSSINTPISPLVTIVTIEKARILEPLAPSIEERLETIRNLKEKKLKPMLFLRPIIPGVTDNE
ncbi:MAG: radical SAM protein, partial [Candidatus Methanomethylicota archaeon]